MSKIMILLVALFLGVNGMVNAQGIQFREGGFEGASKEAKQQNKLIFIDFYTTWCGPCKGLANSVFPKPDVGEYFNRMFVNCKLDAEREGKAMAEKYGVSSYPTLLFVNAEGEVIHKVVGAVDATALIEAGKKAVAGVNDPCNVANLRKRYESGDRDEKFLKMYIEKMAEYREDPSEALEEYLKVQTAMKEGSSKMMEFFMNYSNFFMVGGDAERIYLANIKEYMDIATKIEEKKIGEVYRKMMNRTRQTALRDKDVVLYELFIDRWLKLPEKPYYQDYNDLRLDLLLLKGKMKDYRRSAVIYLDSIVDSRSIEDIHREDQVRYEEYCRKYTGGGFMLDAMKESYKNLDAKLQMKAILKVGSQLVKGAKRKDFAQFPKWIEHGKLLLPDDYQMIDFEANMLYRQGKKEEAITRKQEALGRLNPLGRVYPRVKEDLEKMKAGTF